MIKSSVPTSLPPTGSTGTDVHHESLLHGLRRGEREAFVRYFELYRTPVHDLVRRLLRDGEDAVSATEEVFTRAYRRILLHDGPIDLSGWTYGAALDVCRERLDERAPDHRATGAPGADQSESNDFGRRLGQALGSVSFRHQAALLLHDVTGLSHSDLANVFGLTEDAAGALLFRAREEFRRAFEELSSDRRATSCRLAEQTAAGAVGRGLSDDEARRLDAHAGYCRHCRQAMKGWGDGAVTLALFLDDVPLPEALATTPVFGTAVAITGALPADSFSGRLLMMLAPIGSSLKSRAAAYAVAAVCLAAAVGMAVQQSPGERVFIMAPAMQPRGPAFLAPEASAGRTPASGSIKVVGPGTHSPAGIASSTTWYAGGIGATATTFADAGSPPVSGRSTVGLRAAAGAEAPGDVTVEGDAKDDGEPPKGGHVSAGPWRSGAANGSHAGTAGKLHGKAAKHVPASGTKHVKKTKKDDAGKHQKPAKPAKDR